MKNIRRFTGITRNNIISTHGTTSSKSFNLQCEFESIKFNHVPRAQNHYVDTIANNIPD